MSSTTKMRPLLIIFALVALGLGACAQTPNGPKSELSEPFSLVCLPVKPESEKLTFEFLPSADNGVIAQRRNGVELADFVTQTYENALLWRNERETFSVNRFNGELVRRPSGEKYYCSRRGRRVF
jgi:hypothetical protein